MSKKNQKNKVKSWNYYPLPDKTVLYSHKKHLQPIPEIGKKYHCFDDGKIRFSRHYIVEVSEVLGQMAFKKKYPEEFQAFLSKSKRCYWLYSRHTDYFVITERGEDNRIGVFVRTKQGGWFGIGNCFNCGTLDVTGCLWNNLVEMADDFTWNSEEEREMTIREGTI